jgi:PadR family transcriptional regulator, regulatory protein PadR
MPMPTQSTDLLQGTLDLLVLKVLTWGPRHGYAIARLIEARTGEALRVEEGSLYPALYRMEKRGWIDSEWGTSELNRKAKFYSVTPQGRRQLQDEMAQWARFSSAVARLLRA